MASGSDAEDDGAGTSLKASAGPVTIFKPAKGTSTSKSTNKSKVGAAFEDKDGARQVRAGKYSLVDLDSFESPPKAPGTDKPIPKVVSGHAHSKLELPTQQLMDLIFSDAMFQEAMQDFDIYTERLPLGQLSQEQVQRGYDVLERLRAALAGSGGSLERLSSEFYQVIPHSFGRRRPPIL
ncbi:TPA: Poly [ADP-ribose] polymerase 3 [Trebouxia sp. C0006]